MSRIIASIARPTLIEMIDAARHALRAGADLAELRLDAIGDATIESDAFEVTAASALPMGRWIGTLRAHYEGGASKLPDHRRFDILARCIDAGAGWIDIEYRAIQSDGVARDAALRLAQAGNLIVSSHDFDAAGGGASRHDWPLTVRRMAENVPGAIVKVAWMASDVSDNIAAMRICRENPDKRIAICMGEKGVMSRVLAVKCQAFGTYCAPVADAAIAPGQCAIDQLTDLYRIQSQLTDTKVYGVIGSPVAHSLSPVLFNQQFARDAVDAVYLPLRIDTAEELIRFLSLCCSTEWLSARGFSVTLPHKQAALDWADLCDPLASRIRAANTLKLAGGGGKAFNTDYRGLVDALAAGLDVDATGLAHLNVAILGAGGVARAAVAGLRDLGCDVTIYNRSTDRAESLAGEFECRAEPWERRFGLDADLIINCTSVGLWPNVDDSPLPADAIPSAAAVMDTIYKPVQTRLLRDAASRGCHVINGVEMFIRQAAAQYAIWTGRAMDIDAARTSVLAAIGEDDRPMEAAP